MTATLIEIGALDRTRPAVNAPPVVLADWYERKATMLHQIATETPSERDTYARWADHAHRHAVQLLTETGAGMSGGDRS